MRISLLLLGVLALCGCRSRAIGTADDGGNNSNSACLSGTCEGCCDAHGDCLPGGDRGACGSAGVECADCSALGGQCSEGTCVNVQPCDASNCPGCCSPEGSCLSGQTSLACGVDGETCNACGDGQCVDGACCHDQDGDGYGQGCPAGDDCDDTAPGIVEPCQENGCPQGWAFVPAGTFISGCGDVAHSCGADILLEEEMFLDDFCIERTETPVANWRACYDFGLCDYPTRLPLWDETCNWAEDPSMDRPDHPLNCISFENMLSYCQDWVGGNLPTEFEWEKAGRGTDGRTFPWGDEPTPLDCSRCNYRWCLGEDQATFTWPVDHLSGSDWDSPYGLKDMCGNVWELTRSCLDEVGSTCEEGPDVVVRGETAYFQTATVSDFSMYLRYGVGVPFSGGPQWGFRCARQPWEGLQSPVQN